MIPYNIYSEYLRRKYGEKVYKLPISLPVTCPNRDGTCGINGCAFCGSIGAGYENLPVSMTVSEQIAANKQHISAKYKANKFIPYFQNFSNTYLEVDKFAAFLTEACQEDIVELAIATRPDCINEHYLEAICNIRAKYAVNICVELGLQTVNYHSLYKINRGHSLAEYIDAALQLKKYDIEICTHLILNLPWDNMEDVIENAKVISALGTEQVKLHALYIVKQTSFAELYRQGLLNLISKDEYVDRVIKFLEYLKPDIVVQRIIGRAPAESTLFTNWQTGWWKIKDEIIQKMHSKNTYQGRLCNYLGGAAVKKFCTS